MKKLTAIALTLPWPVLLGLFAGSEAGGFDPRVSARHLASIEVHGDLRDIARNSLNASAPLTSFANCEGLHGIGMPVGLESELLVVDGRATTSQFQDHRYEIANPDNPQLAFFAYGFVDHWIETSIPPEVKDFGELEEFISLAAIKAGFDSDTGFILKVVASVRHLDWFVVGGMGNLEPTPRDSFLRNRSRSGMDDREIEAIGIYSQSLQGIATSPNSPLHLHFRTIDKKSVFVGHLDDSIALEPGGRIMLGRPVDDCPL